MATKIVKVRASRSRKAHTRKIRVTDDSGGVPKGVYSVGKKYKGFDDTVHDLVGAQGTQTVTSDYLKGQGYWKGSGLGSKKLRQKKTSSLRVKVRR